MAPVTDVAGAMPDLIAHADQALVRTVDGLSDDQYAEASQLPGWTRGHVVAHLALNAEGLAGVLHGAHLGRPQPMYASSEPIALGIGRLLATRAVDVMVVSLMRSILAVAICDC